MRTKSLTKLYYCFPLFAALMLHLFSFGQQTGLSSTAGFFKRFAADSLGRFTPSRRYYIVDGDLGSLNPATIARQLGPHTAIVRASNVKDYARFHHLITRPANNDWKFSAALPGYKMLSKRNQNEYIVAGPDFDLLFAKLETLRGQYRMVAANRASNAVVIQCDTGFLLNQVLTLDEVSFVDRKQKAQAEISIIGYNRGFHGISRLDYALPGATGAGIVVGVKEQQLQTSDIDLLQRVLISPTADPDTTNHATVIASIIGGAGNSFYDGRGLAHHCTFFPSSFDNLFADEGSVLHNNRVTVQNHSYGTIVQQFYGAEALSYDELSWKEPYYIPVFSAGNRGTAVADEGPYANIPGFANLTGNFKMAKNVITVGAIDNKGNIAEESSAGPTYDGRLAPHLMALGPNGTSDAAAVVSGTVAVMQQVYRDSNQQQMPPASLVKAILFNTARDISVPHIDFKTGYGRLESYDAVQSIMHHEYDGGIVNPGTTWSRQITVPDNAAQLKVTLNWTDSAAGLNNYKALLNDLDLEVIDLANGTAFQPWILNTAANADSLMQIARRGRDSLNTTEQVSIDFPGAGNYEVKISGHSILHHSFPFNIAWQVDTLNTFQFTNPQHSSDVNREEDSELVIRWKTFVADSNLAGNLWISYDRGANWQLLQGGQRLDENMFTWAIKDTNSTARFKMETPFGDFLSNEFIIAGTPTIKVDFLCSDSIGLSWSRYPYANGYRLYALKNSPYLEPLATVGDTSIVLDRASNPYNIYAVEPLLINNIPAMRSRALDIRSQSVNCFYKNIYHILQDENEVQLFLLLSAPQYVDSAYFEQVTADGVFVSLFNAEKINTTQSEYQGHASGLPGGIVYWRVRLKLKNGATILTDIVPIQTSGSRSVVFYPNPVNRYEPLHYILKQGVPASSRLQLIDMTGRLLRDYTELPPAIDVSAFAAGMIIYRISAPDGRILGRGKLIIR